MGIAGDEFESVSHSCLVCGDLHGAQFTDRAFSLKVDSALVAVVVAAAAASVVAVVVVAAALLVAVVAVVVAAVVVVVVAPRVPRVVPRLSS